MIAEGRVWVKVVDRLRWLDRPTGRVVRRIENS
jgi:hypothetical protein